MQELVSTVFRRSSRWEDADFLEPTCPDLLELTSRNDVSIIVIIVVRLHQQLGLKIEAEVVGL